jgi:hypothetical protein
MDPFLRRQVNGAQREFSSELSELPSTPIPPLSPPLLSNPFLYNNNIDEPFDQYTRTSDVFQDSEDNDDYEEEEDTQYIRRRRRKDEKPKLEAVLQALRQVRWTIHDFLVTFIREKDCERNPIILDRKTAQHRQDYLRNTLNTPKIGSLIL